MTVKTDFDQQPREKTSGTWRMAPDEWLSFSDGQTERWQPELVTHAKSGEDGLREKEGPGFHIRLIVRAN